MNLKTEETKKFFLLNTLQTLLETDFIIECKGRANESFPLRYKLFKKVVNKEQPHVIIYKPQNHKECDKTIELILNAGKLLARKKYAERQIDKWWKWSWEKRNRVKYKELVSYQDKYNIKVYGKED